MENKIEKHAQTQTINDSHTFQFELENEVAL